MEGLLNWLESNAYALWILTSATGWPLMLSLHAIGLATILGVTFALNLRLLGMFSTMPFASLYKMMGIAWIGIGLNIFSGLSVFLTRPAGYLGSTPFVLKMLFILAGIVILIKTRKTLLSEAASWDAAGEASQAGKRLAWGSLLFWILAVIAGRLIAYVDVG